MAGLVLAISIREAVPFLSEMPGTRPGMTSIETDPHALLQP
jgi:hypothetical protein